MLCACLGGGAWGYEIQAQRLFSAGDGAPVLRIISTGDLELFAPLIIAFQAQNPNISIDYTVASSGALYAAIAEEGATFDVALSFCNGSANQTGQ